MSLPASILEHEKTDRRQHVSTLFLPTGSKVCVSSADRDRQSAELVHACLREVYEQWRSAA